MPNESCPWIRTTRIYTWYANEHTSLPTFFRVHFYKKKKKMVRHIMNDHHQWLWFGQHTYDTILKRYEQTTDECKLYNLLNLAKQWLLFMEDTLKFIKYLINGPEPMFQKVSVSVPKIKSGKFINTQHSVHIYIVRVSSSHNNTIYRLFSRKNTRHTIYLPAVFDVCS